MELRKNNGLSFWNRREHGQTWLLEVHDFCSLETLISIVVPYVSENSKAERLLVVVWNP